MTEVNRKIHVVGINSYIFRDLSSKLQDLFLKTENIAVPNSYFEEIKSWSENDLGKKKSFFSSNSNNELLNWLRSQKTDVILISRGDPLWFGIGRILLENFKKDELSFYPSNTCIQLAFNKLKIPWQDSVSVSIHGRDSTKLIGALKARPKSLTIITDSNKRSLEIIKKNLSELNLIDLYDIWLCEELGFDNENIRKLNLKESLPSDISSLNIVILTQTKKIYSNHNLPLFGISDHIFKTFDDRPNLFTKREVRIQILADLELPKNGVIWDIGAGCGSIGLEALKLRPNLNLFCIDQRIGSKALILENSKRLGVEPKFIFEEDINNTLNTRNLSSFEKPNRLVIGGCDKKTKLQIINTLAEGMSIGDIIVIPIIDIHNIKELKKELEDNNFKTNLNLIQTYKSLSIAEGMRLEPNNPIFLLKGKK
ncbi:MULTISPECIES: bifunctional cobalt-precorrin-7 (C(5))-methyltransferase/cobalt-precorrin-6B (C(15))-methyltransferase [Prochlorococcus]|uniref:Cobalt-precorrin-6y C5-methyltransferase n=1 Tax=Prochlorococcus marinus str. MIT 9116 TaxID=167544 RepID=A0A0A1ZY89_PROMR|nr:bifunctional cobalt-precorrin-7 (C(5))-methyltransferase/cobalt-precorrin-6B (C(15))-methyltransferase [Prochlorococcus marinus]KGF91696.1 Cobalt-precorrin-6y C5-methyltransferase [Prochlorococcus marinus str. MIT 9107]KGF93118.1 Cobalt-precorrin-6y C5-methyltransferase [Prochlorococcus marinus str. MIT 9116]KGF95061.1 Cobalt-precorrin-6y C5-methyltransferase [Prochlorococcus marinus str. MIT 9123]